MYISTLAARVVTALISGQSIMNLGAVTESDEISQLSLTLNDPNPHDIPIPGADGMASLAYIKNASTEGLRFSVTWTPNGGSSAVITVLPAGAFILIVQNSPGAATGITALTLQGLDGPNTICDILLGGGATD